MNNHLIPGSERLPTELAAVGPSVCVNPLMFSQQVPPLKVFSTVRALERTLLCVNAANVE